MSIVVAALYKFTRLDRPADIQEALRAACEEHGILGTLLVAHEGINGTISGTRAGIDAILAFIRGLPGLAGLEHKESFAESQPFYRMKVRLKKEIVTIGIPDVDPNDVVGTYVEPKDWNAVISDPDTVVIDTRNDYEVRIGTFAHAVDPKTDTFREFPDYVKAHYDPAKNKKVAMFCTGGIRCEKASAYMKKLGFEEVYHLKGGILKYLEEVPAAESLWQGECFVFDQRVSVGHGLALGKYVLCPSCRHPISDIDRESGHYEEGVSCPNCGPTLSDERRAAARERQKQIRLAEARGEKHIGARYDSAPEG
jgi:UPF0176 protein